MIRRYSALRRVSRTKSVVNGWLTYSCAPVAVWNCMIIILIRLAGTKPTTPSNMYECNSDSYSWKRGISFNLQFTFSRVLAKPDTRFYKNEFTFTVDSRLSDERGFQKDHSPQLTTNNLRSKNSIVLDSNESTIEPCQKMAPIYPPRKQPRLELDSTNPICSRSHVYNSPNDSLD